MLYFRFFFIKYFLIQITQEQVCLNYPNSNKRCSIYYKLNDVMNSNTNDINPTGLAEYLISSYQGNNIMKCLGYCTQLNECGYVLVKMDENKCLICNQKAYNYLNFNTNSQNLVYKKNRTNPNFKKTDGLINYWPFFENFKDVIGTSHLSNPSQVELSFDRNNNLLSSAKISNNFLVAPPGYYFGNANFAVLVWVNPSNYSSYPQLINFGNNVADNNIAISLFGSVESPEFTFLVNTTFKPPLKANKNLLLNEWTHIAFVLQNPNGYIYLNGTLVSSFSSWNYYPVYVLRNYNYIGSGYGRVGRMEAILDELKIFNRDLSQNEILDEINNDYFV